METTSKTQEQVSMKAEPQKEHRWLQKLVGEWTFESEAMMGPDGPTAKGSGTEKVRSLGELWVVGEGHGDMPGCGPADMIITVGYDPEKKKFVGTWFGSMMTSFFIYEGTLDPTGKVLTLETEGPAMTGKGTAKYRDVVEIKSDDHRLLTSQMLGEDGKWRQFMTAHYRRKK